MFLCHSQKGFKMVLKRQDLQKAKQPIVIICKKGAQAAPSQSRFYPIWRHIE